MNTKSSIVAIAAILATVAIPGTASAQVMSLPSSYASNQIETTGVPADLHALGEAGTRHREPHAPKPYGQW